MAQPKTLAAATVVVAFALLPLALSTPAQAASFAGAPKVSQGVHPSGYLTEDGEGGEDGGDDHHSGDDGDHHYKPKDPTQVGVIPPVVIRPHRDEDNGDDDNKGGSSTGGITPVNPQPTPAPSASAGATDPSNLNGASVRGSHYVVAPLDGTPGNPPAGAPGDRHVSAIDPNSSPAIDLGGVRTTDRTPADRFMESASFGLASLLAGGLALAAVAGYRSLRMRKDPNRDFFYEND